MHLIFIRHGDPDYEHDTVTRKGMHEAQLLQKRVSKWAVTDFYTSPMGRAKRTAEIALLKTKRAAKELPWLREFNYPITDPATNQTRIAWDWMPRDFFGERRYFDNERWCDTPAMESGNMRRNYQTVCDGIDGVLGAYGYKRLSFETPIYTCTPHLSTVQAAVDIHLNASQPALDDRTAVFFCHLGVMFAVIGHLTGISPVQLWQGLFVAPTSVTVLGAEERAPGEVVFRVQTLGDCAHLLLHKEPPSASGFYGNCFCK